MYIYNIIVQARFFLFFVLQIFSQQVRVGGRNKNKIHSDHFPIELKLKETQNSVSFNFNFNWKMVRMNFIFILHIKMSISHQVLSLGVI